MSTGKSWSLSNGKNNDKKKNIFWKKWHLFRIADFKQNLRNFFLWHISRHYWLKRTFTFSPERYENLVYMPRKLFLEKVQQGGFCFINNKFHLPPGCLLTPLWPLCWIRLPPRRTDYRQPLKVVLVPDNDLYWFWD